ncbi:MAG: hypothetical protein RJB36_1075 [Bacteroidota bacterium]
MKLMRLFWASFVLFFLLISCQEKKVIRENKIDLKEIRKKGKLTVLMENSSLSYFEYRGKKLGFEYEFMDTFCKSIGIDLEVKIISQSSDFKKDLISGEGDVIAANFVIPFKSDEKLSYTEPFYRTYQVLVQRSNDTVIREPSELAGKNVYVRKGSAFAERLQNLQFEIGSKINVKYKKDDPIAEDLIEMVANNELPFTIAHENLARISQELHPNLNISTKISFLQNIGFGLRKNCPELKGKLDAFIKSYCASPAYAELKKRYFDYLKNEPTEFYIPKKGQISPYDEVFKTEALKYGWDWKIVAAVAFKESRFNPNARGFGGAYGMMQFMPNTGPSFGVFPGSPAEVQIAGGMKYLNRTYVMWKSVPDPDQRMKFTLASYNAGPGHIIDAQKLAKAAGLNPNVWDGNVEIMVGNLDDPAYYRSELVRCGAYRGHAVAYVKHVFGIYNGWR